jgi:GH35 family endo-1,4-beta-xylanase
MKIKKIITVLLVAFIVVSCAPAAKVVPTETPVPMLTFTPEPPTSTFTPVVPTPTSTPIPPIETLPVTQKSVSQFASSMQTAGINITAEQILQQGLEIKTITGADRKQYEIAITHLDPDPNQRGETLEGDYPLMMKTEKGWDEATLKNMAQLKGMEFGAMLNLNKDFHDITINNFGTGYAFDYWDIVQAEKGKWDFSDPDYNIRTAHSQGIDVLSGIIWGKSTPDWVKQLQEEELRAATIDYIQQVMEHNKGQVRRWIVYNEATLHGNDDIFWNKLEGIEAVRLAFATARKTDSSAELIYSDFTNIDSASNDKDRLPTIESIVSQIQKDGNLDGIALQVVSRTSDFDAKKLRRTLDALSKYNLPIHITEFSILINGENTPNNMAKQAEVAAEVISILREYPNVVEVIAFPLEDRIANKIYLPNSNSGLWLKTDSGTYVPKPIVYTMMSVLAQP